MDNPGMRIKELSDWEVVGPEGEYYGRYKTKPPPDKIPIYAIAEKINPDSWHMELGQNPGDRRFEEQIVADYVYASVVGVAAMLGTSLAMGPYRKTPWVRDHKEVLVTSLGWTASSLFFAWRRMSRLP